MPRLACLLGASAMCIVLAFSQADIACTSTSYNVTFVDSKCKPQVFVIVNGIGGMCIDFVATCRQDRDFNDTSV